MSPPEPAPTSACPADLPCTACHRPLLFDPFREQVPFIQVLEASSSASTSSLEPSRSEGGGSPSAKRRPSTSSTPSPAKRARRSGEDSESTKKKSEDVLTYLQERDPDALSKLSGHICVTCVQKQLQSKTGSHQWARRAYLVPKSWETTKISLDSLAPQKKNNNNEEQNSSASNNTWTLKEDLALLKGTEKLGLGNWEDIAGKTLHRSKTAKECCDRFEALRVASGGEANVPYDMTETDAKLRHVASTAKSLPGFMPLRQEFEVVYANDAEALLGDMSFDPAIDTTEWRDLKLKVLRNYNLKLDEREFRKAFILERRLLESKRLLEARQRPDTETTLLSKLEPLARFSSAEEHEALSSGMLREHRLRGEIKLLQQLRLQGIKTVADADAYLRAQHPSKQAQRFGEAGNGVNLEANNPASLTPEEETLRASLNLTTSQLHAAQEVLRREALHGQGAVRLPLTSVDYGAGVGPSSFARVAEHLESTGEIKLLGSAKRE